MPYHRHRCEEDGFLQTALQWYDGTVTTTDSVGEGSHFLIAHCFSELQVAAVTAATPLTAAITITAADTDDDNGSNKRKLLLPKLVSADDAADAGWFSFADIQARQTRERLNSNKRL